MRIWMLAVLAVACGDNTVPIGPPLTRAEHLFIGAHMDDETIFMQPEVVDAVRTSSVTTIFVASGDPVYGDDHALEVFDWAISGYAAVAGSSDWQCGYLMIADLPIHHCRLRDREVSIIGLDLVDGGIQGERDNSFLHLIEGRISTLPILGPIRGEATNDAIVAELAAIIAATAPSEIHTLDLAATHGRDNSSHLMTASYVLWAVATLGYAGPVGWHRGYNVADEAINFDGDMFEEAKWMLGYFEACYTGCGPCGTSCPTLTETHDIWLSRQYGSTRQLDVAGRLASDGGCFSLDGLVDCATAPTVQLGSDGRLAIDGGCLASTADGVVTAELCDGSQAQYWLLDDEGYLWNGRLPEPAAVMDYDHVRCLTANPLGAPTCGATRNSRWQVQQ